MKQSKSNNNNNQIHKTTRLAFQREIVAILSNAQLRYVAGASVQTCSTDDDDCTRTH